ncbi:MAG: hypothetical protein ACLFP1_01135 [Candidatus Goldiibacteriota bacterium]
MTKKILLFIITILICVLIYFLFFNISGRSHGLRTEKTNLKLSPGSTAPSFIIGMKNSTIRELSDFYGSNIIVLAFLDQKKGSIMTRDLLNKKLPALLKKHPDILWFSLSKRRDNIFIQELSAAAGLKYPAPYSDIPAQYNFNRLPVIIVIDKRGIVKLIYDGFSPTLIDDILYSIKG